MWAESYLRISDHPRKLVTLNPKLKSTGAGRLPALFLLVDAYRKQLGLKDFSPEVRTLWHCSRLRSAALYLWLIVVISVSNRPLQQYLGFTAGRWLWSVRAWRLQPDCKIQRSGRNGQRDWCMSRVTAIISALVICIIVCLSWAVNHYRDNAITYKAQRDKMPENWSWRTRQLYFSTCRCVSVMLLRSMQNTRRS